MKNILITVSLLAALVSCKKETTTAMNAPGTSEIESETTDGPEVTQPVYTTTDGSTVRDDDTEMEGGDDPQTSEEYTAGNRRIKTTFRYDAQGVPVAVISESGKADVWLPRKGETNIYEQTQGGTKLTVTGNTIVLTENGKTTTFNMD